MARNSAGTHSLPLANVVSGTAITPTWANTTLADLSTEMTDSLSRSGKGGMTAPIRCADGTVAAPAFSFTSETGTGWYRSAAGVIRAAILGTYRLLLNATGLEVNGTLAVSGSATITGRIDRPSLPLVGQQISSSSSNYSNAAATVQAVTNLSVSITTTGRPVLLMIQPDGGVNGAYIGSDANTDKPDVFIYFARGGANIATFESLMSTGGATAGLFSGTGFPMYLDAVGAGTYTYDVRVLRGGAQVTSCLVYYVKLVAFEL